MADPDSPVAAQSGGIDCLHADDDLLVLANGSRNLNTGRWQLQAGRPLVLDGADASLHNLGLLRRRHTAPGPALLRADDGQAVYVRRLGAQERATSSACVATSYGSVALLGGSPRCW